MKTDKTTNENAKLATRMLRRTRGVTIDELQERLHLNSEKKARNLIDSLRRLGSKVERVEPRRFRLLEETASASRGSSH